MPSEINIHLESWLWNADCSIGAVKEMTKFTDCILPLLSTKLGRSYKYLIRKFTEGSVQNAGEFYTPVKIDLVMPSIVVPEPGRRFMIPSATAS